MDELYFHQYRNEEFILSSSIAAFSTQPNYVISNHVSERSTKFWSKEKDVTSTHFSSLILTPSIETKLPVGYNPFSTDQSSLRQHVETNISQIKEKSTAIVSSLLDKLQTEYTVLTELEHKKKQYLAQHISPLRVTSFISPPPFFSSQSFAPNRGARRTYSSTYTLDDLESEIYKIKQVIEHMKKHIKTMAQSNPEIDTIFELLYLNAKLKQPGIVVSGQDTAADVKGGGNTTTAATTSSTTSTTAATTSTTTSTTATVHPLLLPLLILLPLLLRPLLLLLPLLILRLLLQQSTPKRKQL